MSQNGFDIAKEQRSKAGKTRSYCYTANNYNKEDEDYLQSIPCKYHVYGKETGESGTPHLQGFIQFNTPRYLGSVIRLINSQAGDHEGTPHIHVEKARSASHIAALYCKKGEQRPSEWKAKKDAGPNFGKNADVWEKGDPPTMMTLTSRAEKNRHLINTNFAKLVDDGDVSPYQAPMLYRTRCILQQGKMARKTEDVRGVWIVGPPGTGKSHYTHTHWPQHFVKNQNKWFDGYDDEDVIVLDDLDCDHFGHLLKRWADKWPVTGEVKGGTVNLNHSKFVVTSNYTIEDLYGLPDKNGVIDKMLVNALKRRFKVIRMNKKFTKNPNYEEEKYPKKRKRMEIPRYAIGKDGSSFARSPGSIAEDYRALKRSKFNEEVFNDILMKCGQTDEKVHFPLITQDPEGSKLEAQRGTSSIASVHSPEPSQENKDKTSKSRGKDANAVLSANPSYQESTEKGRERFIIPSYN